MCKLVESFLTSHTLSERESERKRIARELHDQVIQDLVGLNYSLSHLHSAANLEAQIVEMQHHVRHILDTVRNICTDIRSAPLDLIALTHAIRVLVQHVEQSTPLRAILVVSGDTTYDVHPTTNHHLLRIAQEALLNVQKHAVANEVQIRLAIGIDAITLTIIDDGVGFDIAARQAQHTAQQCFGIIGIQERLELLGGHLHITSTPHSGTHVYAYVPL